MNQEQLNAAAMAEAQDVLNPTLTREQELAQMYFTETETDETRDFIGGLFLILYYYFQAGEVNELSLGVDNKRITIKIEDFKAIELPTPPTPPESRVISDDDSGVNI